MANFGLGFGQGVDLQTMFQQANAQPAANSIMGMSPQAFAAIAGQLGQAFSAQDPNSWQHQLGGVAGNWGATGQYYDALRRGVQPYAQIPVLNDPGKSLTPPPSKLEDMGPMAASPMTQTLTFDRKMLQEILAGYGGRPDGK